MLDLNFQSAGKQLVVIGAKHFSSFYNFSIAGKKKFHRISQNKYSLFGISESVSKNIFFKTDKSFLHARMMK